MARVLVVDDEPGIREFVAEALLDDDHEVAQAASGEAAWALLEREGFDVVLSDLRMPGMDGMALLRRLRERQPDVEVVILTAHGDVDTAVEAMRLGAFDYLQKPLGSLGELRLLIRRAAERRSLRNFQEAHQSAVEAGPELTFGAPAMTPVVAALRKVAVTDATVLLIGESGTGKEIAARAVHAWSRRRGGPFVAVNCAALAEQLLESELFGHEKGAFTGAVARRRGRIEVAQGGTFFLDEVGELALPLQAKLLRLLQERTFERIGGGPTLRADVRWIAATNRDLPAMIADGRFREDLFHRLAVFPVVLPPLRERREDIEPLAERLLAQACANLGRKPLRLDPSARALLRRARWSGNVRELANTLERAAILADGEVLHDSELAIPGLGLAPAPVAPSATPATSAAPAGSAAHTAPAGEPRPLQDLERDAIEAALRHFEGNRIRTAEALGIGVRTLYDKIKRYNLGE
ncbi:sigma-54 dependent transcriptional regulator [Nannocystis sp. SCPEA4]|uniref:sigma-54-dependent transcriptional regulator n=1 Tax=Nannocystis sp. SCPEA4 TaxID=2996787 RepID=UPI00226FFD16|nr:sigma-54 dependent transcriptional regulator [Nannocystis sp. SCPEA4]MCY1054011.1 sigma-54 dependent transcriptional regulator [Nannocystis sp. SCPEA4]